MPSIAGMIDRDAGPGLKRSPSIIPRWEEQAVGLRVAALRWAGAEAVGT